MNAAFYASLRHAASMAEMQITRARSTEPPIYLHSPCRPRKAVIPGRSTVRIPCRKERVSGDTWGNWDRSPTNHSAKRLIRGPTLHGAHACNCCTTQLSHAPRRWQPPSLDTHRRPLWTS